LGDKGEGWGEGSFFYSLFVPLINGPSAAVRRVRRAVEFDHERSFRAIEVGDPRDP
jgi:hypothetical protein